MPPQKKRPAEYSTAEALAQFARELSVQVVEVEQTREVRDWTGDAVTPVTETSVDQIPVFTDDAVVAIVVEAARVLIADGLNLRGE